MSNMMASPISVSVPPFPSQERAVRKRFLFPFSLGPLLLIWQYLAARASFATGRTRAALRVRRRGSSVFRGLACRTETGNQHSSSVPPKILQPSRISKYVLDVSVR